MKKICLIAGLLFILGGAVCAKDNEERTIKIKIFAQYMEFTESQARGKTLGELILSYRGENNEYSREEIRQFVYEATHERGVVLVGFTPMSIRDDVYLAFEKGNAKEALKYCLPLWVTIEELFDMEISNHLELVSVSYNCNPGRLFPFWISLFTEEDYKRMGKGGK